MKNKGGINPKVSKRNNKYYLTFNRDSTDKMLKLLEKSFNKYAIPDSIKYKLGRLWEGNKERLDKERIKKNNYKKEWRAKKRAIRLVEKEKGENEQIARIKELYYKKEKSLYEIAKSLGYKSHVSILKIMKKYELKRRTLSQACIGKRNGFFGKKHTQQTKNKISKSKKEGNK